MGVRTPASPHILVLRCDECGKRVNRAGYIKIDRQAVAQNRRLAGGGFLFDTNSDAVYWQILHSECDAAAKPTDYRLPSHLFSTTGDLLEATAYLLRNQSELVAGSNWHGLIGRVLADTREYADWLASPERAESNRARKLLAAKRRHELADPNDSRHGTAYGYQQCGCKCDRCKAANAEQSRRDRAANSDRDRDLVHMTGGQSR